VARKQIRDVGEDRPSLFRFCLAFAVLRMSRQRAVFDPWNAIASVDCMGTAAALQLQIDYASFE
jgi:hypothetical protein